MEPTLRDLAQVLKSQKAIYEELVQLAEEKQKELVAGSIEKIDALNRREEALIFQVGRLEEERHGYTRRLLLHLGLKENSTLKSIIDAVKNEESQELEVVARELTAILNEIDKRNQENMSLIRQSLRYINFSVDVLTQQSEASTYRADKEVQRDGQSRLLDKRV